LRGRRGRWRDAVADLSKTVELRPDLYIAFRLLAAALLEEGDLEAYHHLCVQIRERFGGTDSEEIAASIAWTCLIVPSPDSMSVSNDSRLADMALKLYKGDWLLMNHQNCKALAEYRQGHFASAAEWASKALSQPEYCCDRRMVRTDPYRRVQASMLLAMSNYRLGQLDKARVALERGLDIAEAKLEKIESGDFGQYWVNWVYAHVLMREATALMQGGAKAGAASSPGKDPP